MTNYDLGLDDQLSDDEVEELDAMASRNPSTEPTPTSHEPGMEGTQAQGKSTRLTAWFGSIMSS